MKKHDPAAFHKLYGEKKPRAIYYPKDFLDYTVMMLITATILFFAYGFPHPMSILGLGLCAFVLVMFPVRHGVEWKVPLLLRRPQDVFFVFVYKIQNLPMLYLIAIAILLVEQVAIAYTPNLPHRVELMRKIGLILFYSHFLIITGYRTAVLIAHLAKRKHAKTVLMETPWKRAIQEKTNITLEILHAYATGLLTHLVLITPWYLVMTHVKYSLLFTPVISIVNIVVHLRWLKATNEWFYRDHWLGHNCELEFIYLHGTHHDAIPCALIGVAGNGFLEGWFRGTMAFPIPFYHPFIPFLVYSYEVKQDMELHQYIPGIFPKMPKKAIEIGQHSTHHYGRLEPYSIAIKVDQPHIPEAMKRFYQSPRVRQLFPDELLNSLKLDEELNGFQWDNPTHRLTLSLWDKYQK